jgi:hypothetical protein
VDERRVGDQSRWEESDQSRKGGIEYGERGREEERRERKREEKRPYIYLVPLDQTGDESESQQDVVILSPKSDRWEEGSTNDAVQAGLINE